MEAIINVEDRLRVIKSIFELCIEAKVFPDEIFIYTIYQKWPTASNFRAEVLALNLNDTRNTKTIEVIYGLSSEVISLFYHTKEFAEETIRQFRYKIDCMPYGPSTRLYLSRQRVPPPIKKGEIWSDEQIKEFNKIDRFGLDQEWHSWKGFDNEEKSDSFYTSSLFLVDFAWRINAFLDQRFFNNSNAIERPEKGYKSLTRARAFYINEILKRPEHLTKRQSRKEIEKLAEDEFPGQSGATIYDTLRLAKDELDKENHSKDFNYGMSLYKSKYPDS